MQYRRLGASGIEVSALGLGTMMLGRWGNPDEQACRQMADEALDAGVTLFDTADIYDFGASEEILGRALAGRRDRVVLATKVGNAMSIDRLTGVAESAGSTLVELALGFVLAHPTVTAALIGPRTPEQLGLLLAAADVTLPDDVLAVIDRIVAPGVTINPVDNG